MKKQFLFGLLVLIVFTSCHVSKTYTVAFYNVENLFDTIDAPNKLDEEFTPGSQKKWDMPKYEKKISDMAHVISSIDSVNFPVLVGLCEVENDHVLNDLVVNAQLKKAGYRYVWKDGPDIRGIDCALLYKPTIFKLKSYEMLPVKDPDNPDFKTRDIICAEGSIGGETFYVFVNHWPSRRGGEEISENKRMLAASVLRNKVDDIFAADSMANIIIMGDFNDEPSDSSVTVTLRALPDDRMPKSTDLVDLMYDEMKRGEGSYNYRGEWDMIDNLIVSGSLIVKKKGLKTTLDDGYIFHKPFMEFVNSKGEMSPNRTYGRTYYGGISDHFPVYMTLTEN